MTRAIVKTIGAAVPAPPAGPAEKPPPVVTREAFCQLLLGPIADARQRKSFITVELLAGMLGRTLGYVPAVDGRYRLKAHEQAAVQAQADAERTEELDALGTLVRHPSADGEDEAADGGGVDAKPAGDRAEASGVEFERLCRISVPYPRVHEQLAWWMRRRWRGLVIVPLETGRWMR